MKPEHVRARVRSIGRVATDYELAHRLEDSLHRDVLAAIALGLADDPSVLAEEALKSKIDFPRYRA